MNVNRKRVCGAVLAAVFAAGASAAEMTIFKQPNFSGEGLTLRGDTVDLTGRGFEDQASSIVVNSGRWQVCTQPNFQGDCLTLDRGQYAALDQRLNHRVESAREVSNVAAIQPGWLGRGDRDRGGDRYADNRGGNRYPEYRGGGAVVELFDGQDFRGRR